MRGRGRVAGQEVGHDVLEIDMVPAGFFQRQRLVFEPGVDDLIPAAVNEFDGGNEILIVRDQDRLVVHIVERVMEQFDGNGGIDPLFGGSQKFPGTVRAMGDLLPAPGIRASERLCGFPLLDDHLEPGEQFHLLQK